jgi:hypothetical protein
MAALLLSAAGVLDESGVEHVRHEDWRWCDVCRVWARGDWQEHVAGGWHHDGLRLVEVHFALTKHLTGMHLPAGHVRHMTFMPKISIVVYSWHSQTEFIPSIYLLRQFNISIPCCKPCRDECVQS